MNAESVMLIAFSFVTLVLAIAVLFIVLRVRRQQMGLDEPSNVRLGRHLGPYRLLKPIGGGGMAEVFLAKDQQGKQVALKVLRPEFIGDPMDVARFYQEGTVLHDISIKHPGTPAVGYIAAGRDERSGRPYLVLEYVPGERLDKLIERKGRLDAETIKVIARDVTLALDATHSVGYCHQDVSADNVILVGENGTVKGAKLIDYGVSSPEGREASRDRGVTFGKLAYMSPEQCGGENVTRASDLYSLGVILFQTTAGFAPFQSLTNSPPEIMEMHREMPPPPLPADVIGPIRDVVGSLLQKDPAARMTAASVRARIGINGGPATLAPPPVAAPIAPSPFAVVAPPPPPPPVPTLPEAETMPAPAPVVETAAPEPVATVETVPHEPLKAPEVLPYFEPVRERRPLLLLKVLIGMFVVALVTTTIVVVVLSQSGRSGVSDGQFGSLPNGKGYGGKASDPTRSEKGEPGELGGEQYNPPRPPTVAPSGPAPTGTTSGPVGVKPSPERGPAPPTPKQPPKRPQKHFTGFWVCSGPDHHRIPAPANADLKTCTQCAAPVHKEMK